MLNLSHNNLKKIERNEGLWLPWNTSLGAGASSELFVSILSPEEDGK